MIMDLAGQSTGGVFLKIDADQTRTDVDLAVIRAWWSLRSLLAIRWRVEHGFDPASPGCEIDVLKSVGTR
ncbi:hypothetical protein [Solwaraspora sp. WMMD792]|uniref:hypothetical protein n=1 Tax=Solwaraspora sp. WMMD792 TaxID=3016099 RepID=UPI0024178A20|nr:hypothetical protein [Solwaraspora sp. WMMD792]MDG4774384.1 hypothetical protein [Solwaraspora sp. WMMD792]